MINLKGKNVLITGSSQGIGKELALSMAQNGANVMIHGINNDIVLQVADEIKMKYDVTVGCSFVNLADEDACDRLYSECQKELGHIDIFVSNAAIQYERKWESATRKELLDEMAINVWPLIGLSQLFVPDMKKNQFGRIIAMGSVQQDKPNPYTVTYASGKSAINNIVKSLAIELGASGITVNYVAPGVVSTPRLESYLETKPVEEVNILMDGIPLKRFARSNECSGVIMMLVSDAGSYITGADIAIDGGMRL